MGSGFLQLAAGMDVYGSNGHLIGKIKDVGEDEIVVHRMLQPTVHIPLDAVCAVTAQGVTLCFTAGEIDDLYWTHAGEDMDVNLHGIYTFDYVAH